MGFFNRLQHGWNAFMNRDPTENYNYSNGITYSYRPDRVRFSCGNEKSIVTSIYNRIAIDAAAISIKHVRLDENDRYVETIMSGLNDCLNIEANIDQTGRAFLQDVYMSIFDEGCIAIVPVTTSINPKLTSSYDILSMRTGKILEWRPDEVKVRLYNDINGKREEIWIKKKYVGIVENPLYSIVNERNSTMQRLIRKMNLIDAVDEQSTSGKLDMIIQLPYTVRSELRRQQADKRRKDLEEQLKDSKFGIGYVDAAEKITQLNRPIENNLLKQIEYLTSTLYGQLGITQTVLDGTADEKTMLNYYNRTIEPLVNSVVDELKRKFLTKTARSQHQSIAYFRNPFSLVPVNDIAEIADKFTRNEIMTSNEIRQVIGMKPSDDPKADQLVNSNIAQPMESQEQYQELEEQPMGEESKITMDTPISQL